MEETNKKIDTIKTLPAHVNPTTVKNTIPAAPTIEIMKK